MPLAAIRPWGIKIRTETLPKRPGDGAAMSCLYWRMSAPRRYVRTRPRVWRIDQQVGPDFQYVGIIVAPDRTTAIKHACEKFNVQPAQLVANELPRGRLLTARRPAG